MMSVTMTHPIDQTRVRSQTQRLRLGRIQTARNTVRSSGVRELWTRLSGSLVRQATYGSSRFGIYVWLKDRDLRRGRRKSRWCLGGNGAVARVIAGVVGAPAGRLFVLSSSLGLACWSDGRMDGCVEEEEE